MNTALWRRVTPRQLLMASIVAAWVTIALKTAAWYVTGSVGLLSDALESLVNLAGATFGLWMVTIAARPADEDHPFGHHKAEYFSSGFEGILIVVAALGIVWAAVSRWLEPQPLEQLDWGLALSVGSSAINGGLAWVMLRAARVHRSMALEGDARHLMTDVWTSVGVVGGLALAGATGWLWLDPLVAVAVAVNILHEGSRLIWQSAQGLMDEAVDADVLARIEGTMQRYIEEHGVVRTVRFDHLYTRKAGHRCYVDVHMHVPGAWSLARAAELRTGVEQALMDAVPGLRASIQLLPHNVEAPFEKQEGQ